MRGTSACTGTWYSARPGFTIRPVRGSTSVSSVSAVPIPITIPPRSWLVAVFALITVPTSNTDTQRDTRTSPVSSSTSTSQKCAPVAARTQRLRSFTMPPMNRTMPAARPSRVSEPTRASSAGRAARVRIAA